ncbi:hypothetical protein ACX0G7_09565 [Flavitalea antarctica]
MIQLLFVLINIAMAWYHAKLIRENKPIVHSLWAAGYLAAVVIATIITKDIILFVLLFVERKLVFDIALNVFRGKPPFWISETTTSVIDRIQDMFFDYNGKTWAVIYIGAIVVLNVLMIFL